MWDLLVLGVLAGGMLALVAVGLTLIFGVMDVMNFAHGEFVMIGMLGTAVLVGATGLPPYVVGLGLLVLAVPVSYVMYLVIIRPTIGKSLNVQIFTTLGLSIILQALALMTFGSRTYAVDDSWSAQRVSLLGVPVEAGRLVAFLGGLALIAGIWALLYRTRWGRSVRAVAEDQYAAKVVGLNVQKAFAAVFVLGTVFAVAAGVLLAPFTAASSTTGLSYILTSFVIVVLGGFGSLPGALIGGVLVGVVETTVGYYVGTQWMQASAFALFVLVLALRPRGLFGRKSLDAAMVGG